MRGVSFTACTSISIHQLHPSWLHQLLPLGKWAQQNFWSRTSQGHQCQVRHLEKKTNVGKKAYDLGMGKKYNLSKTIWGYMIWIIYDTIHNFSSLSWRSMAELPQVWSCFFETPDCGIPHFDPHLVWRWSWHETILVWTSSSTNDIPNNAHKYRPHMAPTWYQY